VVNESKGWAYAAEANTEAGFLDHPSMLLQNVQESTEGTATTNNNQA
jgi:hypothetical protein